MKTQKIKTVLFSTLLVLSASFVKADVKEKDAKSVKYSMEAYVDKLKNGFNSDLKNIFADNVKFSIQTNGKIFSHGKKEELAFMKENEGVKQQCDIATSVIVAKDNYSLIKVSMKYENFVREDYVTMVKTEKNWKITDVTSSFVNN